MGLFRYIYWEGPQKGLGLRGYGVGSKVQDFRVWGGFVLRASGFGISDLWSSGEIAFGASGVGFAGSFGLALKYLS